MSASSIYSIWALFLLHETVVERSRHLPAQSQQKNHKHKVWNIFKVNNKVTKTTSLASQFWTFNCRLRCSLLFIHYYFCYYYYYHYYCYYYYYLLTLTEVKIVRINIYIAVAIPLNDKDGMLIKVNEKKRCKEKQNAMISVIN